MEDTTFNKLIEEKAKEYASQYVKKAVKEVLKDYDTDHINQIAYDFVESKLDKLITKNELSIEEIVTNAFKKEMMEWVKQNMYYEDIIACVKTAMVEKLGEMSFNDLLQLANNLKREGKE